MRLPVAAVAIAVLCRSPLAVMAQPSTSDLDAFMAQVLARRGESWRTLQQYVLDEREIAEIRGPGGTRLYGLEREYTWYIRDGVFVRSPVRFDGVPLSDEERRRYEAEWLEQELERDRNPDAEAPGAHPGTPATPEGDAHQLARLIREPRFISAAYFLEFEFEPGHYALVGPEQYEGRRVLRIEYYPTRLFSDDDDGTPAEGGTQDPDDEGEGELERQMNKVALVTLWVDPERHQIVKYTFENLDMDFMPGRWFARAEDIRATMRMEEPFPGVWLPRGIVAQGAITLAAGTYSVRYQVAYRNYREADVKVRVR